MNKSIHTNIRILFVCVVLSVFPRVVSGQQYRFHSEVTSSGNCTGLDHLQGAVFLEASRSMANTYNSMIFSSKAECEATRNSFAGTQNVTGCIVTITCTMCTPIGSSSSSSINTINPSGPTQGSSYFSSNPANEILDWSEDTKRLQEALDINYKELGDSGSYQKYPTGHTSIRINNESFNEARDGSRGIDITKQYTPSQERENTMEEVSYIDNYSVFQEFTQLRNSGELQYETPEDFIEAMIQQSEELWLEILKLADMPPETFMYILNEVMNEISWESNRHNLIFENELKEAEYKYALAKYMVAYEQYKIAYPISALSNYTPEAVLANETINTKTSDEKLKEMIEELAKELIEKYGVTEKELQMLRDVVNDKDNYANQWAKLMIAPEDVNLGEWLGYTKNLTEMAGEAAMTTGKIISPYVIAANSAGFLVNQGIVLYGLWQEKDTLGDRIQRIKDEHWEFEKTAQRELDKANAISTFFENHNKQDHIRDENMPYTEKIEWVLKSYKSIKQLEENGKDNLVNIFPGKVKERIHQKTTNIQVMP